MQSGDTHASFTSFTGECVKLQETSAETYTVLKKTGVDKTDISSRAESTISPEMENVQKS